MGVSWARGAAASRARMESQLHRGSRAAPITDAAGQVGKPGTGLLARDAVDAFADQVGVAVVPGVLLDHVDVEPAQRPFAVPLPAPGGEVEGEVASQVVGDPDLRL